MGDSPALTGGVGLENSGQYFYDSLIRVAPGKLIKTCSQLCGPAWLHKLSQEQRYEPIAISGALLMLNGTRTGTERSSVWLQ